MLLFLPNHKLSRTFDHHVEPKLKEEAVDFVLQLYAK